MFRIMELFLKVLLTLIFCLSPILVSAAHQRVPILTYHNFDPIVPGSMTISPQKFEEQVKWLKENGYTIIPLKDLVNYLQGKIAILPPKPVVITDDDGKKSVYTYMLPIVLKYKIPVTLFIYPISISHASYALTWKQLKELQQTGLFDIQCHTYWHPNFRYEKKHLTKNKYEKFVQVQLVNSKKILDEKLGTHITLLAWPYGFYDEYLQQAALKAGYEMAFSIDDSCACKAQKPMSQPRFMIGGSMSMKRFATIMDVK